MVKAKSDLIAQDLASKIKHGQFKCGEYLPSENQLTDLYGASRETIRKALQQLMTFGLIQKIKGKGSVVLDLQKFAFPISGISSFAELNKSLKMHAETRLLQDKMVDSLPPLFKKYFPEQLSNTGIYVERLRLINDEPVVLDCDFLLNPPVEQLPAVEAKHSIYSYIENQLGLEVSYATKTITVEKITDDFQEKLQLPNQQAVLVASQNYLADTTLFQLTLSFHNPRRFKFIDFARRQKIKI